MSTSTARRIVAVAALACGALFATSGARASDIHWSVGINAPLYPGEISTVISNGRHYAPPPPVYVRPAPIYYARLRSTTHGLRSTTVPFPSSCIGTAPRIMAIGITAITKIAGMTATTAGTIAEAITMAITAGTMVITAATTTAGNAERTRASSASSTAPARGRFHCANAAIDRAQRVHRMMTTG